MMKKNIFIVILITFLLLNLFFLSVKGENEKIVIKLQKGNKTIYINDQPLQMDVAPIEVPPGRIMVPVRFVSEGLGASVNWDGKTETITITMDSVPFLKYKIIELSNEIENKNKEIEDLKKKLTENVDLSDLKKQLEEKETTIKDLNKKVEDLNKIIEEKNKEIDLLKEKIKSLNQEIDDLKKIIDNKNKEIEELKKQKQVKIYEFKEWDITDDEIQKAISWGEKYYRDEDILKFSNPFMFGYKDVYKTFVAVNTPIAYIAIYAREMKRGGKKITNYDINNILSIFKNEIIITAFVFGDKSDFTKNMYGYIHVEGYEYLYPLYPMEIDNQETADMTDIYPSSPKYYALNDYTFDNHYIPKDSKIKFTLINQYGKPEIFDIDLSLIVKRMSFNFIEENEFNSEIYNTLLKNFKNFLKEVNLSINLKR